MGIRMTILFSETHAILIKKLRFLEKHKFPQNNIGPESSQYKIYILVKLYKTNKIIFNQAQHPNLYFLGRKKVF